MVRKRCGSGAEAVRKRCGSGAEAVQLVELPGRDIASLRDNSPGLLLHDLHPAQYWTRRKPHRCCRLLLAGRRWLLQAAESFCTQHLVQNGGQGYSKSARHFSPELTPCHGVRSLFGHPRSISSPIVQVHVVVWKGEGAELWVKRCTVKSLLCPGQELEHLSREWQGE